MPDRAIATRILGDHVVIEDYEIEGGKASLLRTSKLTSEQATRIGRELIRLSILLSMRRPA